MSKPRWRMWREPDGEWQLGNPFDLSRVPPVIETMAVMTVAEHEEIVHEFAQANHATIEVISAREVQVRDELERLKLADELRQITETRDA